MKDSVEFEVELLEFDRMGHWQNISMAQRLEMAHKLKAKAKELFQHKKFDYAKSIYERY